MVPEPLHPALVHFPIALMVMLPIAAVANLMLIRRGSTPIRSWLWVVAVAALLFGSSWLALRTGEAQEERVEEIVPESAIHEHEESAETFLMLSGLAVVILAAGTAKGRIGHVARYAGTVAAVFLVIAGYRVGVTGGELVYEHGAARAYTTDPVGPGQDPARHEAEGHEESDEGTASER